MAALSRGEGLVGFRVRGLCCCCQNYDFTYVFSYTALPASIPNLNQPESESVKGPPVLLGASRIPFRAGSWRGGCSSRSGCRGIGCLVPSEDEGLPISWATQQTVTPKPQNRAKCSLYGPPPRPCLPIPGQRGRHHSKNLPALRVKATIRTRQIR